MVEHAILAIVSTLTPSSDPVSERDRRLDVAAPTADVTDGVENRVRK